MFRTDYQLRTLQSNLLDQASIYEASLKDGIVPVMRRIQTRRDAKRMRAISLWIDRMLAERHGETWVDPEWAAAKPKIAQNYARAIRDLR